MTADYAARVRTLAARHNREWQLLVEEMDGPKPCTCDAVWRHLKDPACPIHGTAQDPALDL